MIVGAALIFKYSLIIHFPFWILIIGLGLSALIIMRHAPLVTTDKKFTSTQIAKRRIFATTIVLIFTITNIVSALASGQVVY